MTFHRVGRWTAALALALGSGSLANAQTAEPAPPGVEARVSLEPPHILVGDRVVALLTVPLGESETRPTFPDWSKGWGKAEVVEAGPVSIEGEGASRAAVQRLTITAFEVGQIELPVRQVDLGNSRVATTPSGLALEVRSVIAPDDQEKAPAPPAPPRAQPVPRAAWYALAAATLLAAGAGVLAYRRKYAADALAAPALAPRAELERALGLLAARTPNDAFRGLSLAYRRYLGRIFDFHALESTTAEVQRRLHERSVPRDLLLRSSAILRLADQVKFARRAAAPDEAAQRIAETASLAVDFEALLAPQVAQTSEADAASSAERQ